MEFHPMIRCFFSALLLMMTVGPLLAIEGPTAEDCAMCHDEIAAGFALSPHGTAMADRSDQIFAGACATCHQAGEAHMDDPSTDNILRQPADDACLSCHTDQRAAIDSSTPAHVRLKVGCTDCHNAGHDSPEGLHADRDRCVECHQGVAASFNLPYAHRNGTRAFDCASCHSIHGQNHVARSILTSNGGACIECHTEKRLPMVFPHPPADRRGCVSCHMPHGSTNPRQLQRPSVMMLCLECHADVPSYHDLSGAKYRNCQTCHTAIHGSNHDPSLLNE